MSDIAISCEGLSKQYRIGERESYKALRDVVTDAAASPFRRVRDALRNGNGSATRNSKLETPDSFWALEDVSFEVKRGEVIGIIGRNGAGKSTLLRILSRITKPTRGHAKIHGRVGSLLEVGTGFHPELTGRENIYLNAAILGMRKAEVERKFDEIVAFAEVEKFIDTPVKRYSSGMSVRLAFAVAAHMETEVLLVDEVLAVGDAQFQKKCLGKMNDVSKEGRTVLFVSHDMNAIQILCQKTIHLENGKIVGFGDTATQIAGYLGGRKFKSAVTVDDSLCLAQTLEIRRFEFAPNPVVSGQPVDFELELSATETIRLDEIAILVSSALGRRLAIIDLRRGDRTYRLNGNGVERISGRIKNLPLVEGDYQIGLYLNWGVKKGDFYDLLELHVLNITTTEDIVPYHPSARGVLQLDYEISKGS
ncbi:MAG TPA: ABC transporter ATP-binding protein [Pyrinomonadaceae bacterium]